MASLLAQWSAVKREVNGAISLDLAQERSHLAYRRYLFCLSRLVALLAEDADENSACVGADGSSSFSITPDRVAQRRNYVKLSRQCLDRVGDLVDASPPFTGGAGVTARESCTGGGRDAVLGNASQPSSRKTSPAQTPMNSDDIALLLPDVPGDLPDVPGNLPDVGVNGVAGSAKTTFNSKPLDPGNATATRGTNSCAPTTRFRPSTPSNASSKSHHHDATTAAFRRRTGGAVRYLPNVNLAQNQKATNNMAAFRKMEEEREIAKKTRALMEKRLEERKRTIEADALARFNDGNSTEDREKATFYTNAKVVEEANPTLTSLRNRLTSAKEAGDDESPFVDSLIAKILSIKEHPLTELIFRLQSTLINRLRPLVCPYVKELDAVVVPYVDRKHSTTSSSSPDEDASSSTDNSTYVADLERRKFEAQKVSVLEEEAFERHLETVAQDVRLSVELIMSRLTLLYGESLFGESEAASASRDRALADIEAVFFKPLWPLLVNTFRLANKRDEIQLAKVMTANLDLRPQDLGVPDSLCLLGSQTDRTSQHGYEPVVAELRRLASITAPLVKLECLVHICKVVCGCVDAIRSFNHSETSDSSDPGSGNGGLGADDLLPILSFAILQSRLPQLASESRAMSEFIHESYQMGEEGYCLISIQTAIGYLTRLEDDD